MPFKALSSKYLYLYSKFSNIRTGSLNCLTKESNTKHDHMLYPAKVSVVEAVANSFLGIVIKYSKVGRNRTMRPFIAHMR